MTGLQLDNITLAYDGRVIVDRLSLDVPVGRFTAIIGPNGCGKSTTLKALARTLRPRSGRVLLDGADVQSMRPRRFAQRVASLPQDPTAPDSLLVRELVSRGRHPYRTLLRQWLPADAAIIEEAMAATGVDEFADQPVSELSGGQRQRAWIAMVLAQRTDTVLLDEPTSFLDIAHQIDVLHLCQDMRDDGRTVVAVLHDLNQAARYADEVIVMSDGAIVASGRPDTVISAPLVGDAFGLDAVIDRDSQTGTPVVTARSRAPRGTPNA